VNDTGPILLSRETPIGASKEATSAGSDERHAVPAPLTCSIAVDLHASSGSGPMTATRQRTK